MKTIGVAVKAIILRDGNLLLLKKSKEENVAPETWDLPGGRVEYGEAPQKALEREVFEETGLRVSVDSPTRVWSFMDGKLHLVGITFLCRYLSGEVILSGEHTKHIWMAKGTPLELPEWLHKEIFAIPW